MVDRLKVEDCSAFVFRFNFFRGTKDWSLEEWKVEGGRARMFWEPGLRLGVDRCDAVMMDSVRYCERLQFDDFERFSSCFYFNLNTFRTSSSRAIPDKFVRKCNPKMPRRATRCRMQGCAATLTGEGVRAWS